MPRLIDLIRRDKHTPTPLPDSLPVFIADELWRGIDESPDRDWINADFPNIAPPFPSFLIEARSSSDKDFFAGLLFTDFTEEPFALPSGLTPPPLPKLKDMHGDVRWRLAFSAVRYLDRRLQWLPVVGFMHIAEDGTWLDESAQIPMFTDGRYIRRTDEARRWVDEACNYIPFALLTLSMLHCKNIEIVENVPPAKLSQRAKKDYGVPLHITKTLAVRPTKRVSENPGKLDSPRSLAAQHIVRGHFKEFTDEAPLFGKWTGMYWWEPAVRGKAERGKVEKQYKVKGE